MKTNLLEVDSQPLAEELCTVLVENKGVKIERIVSGGQASPEGFWYDQEQAEWVMLLSGSASLSIQKEGNTERVELKKGDSLLIPAHQRHRIESTSSSEKTIWIAVFYEDPLD